MEASNSAKKPDDKVCRVCGDKALGYNFSVITCESCKAFFRRNAIKDKQHKCPFRNECKIDVVTRRFCQKCRLDKCLLVGMKKEWIMSEEEKLLKNAKINENKSRRKLENTNPFAVMEMMNSAPSSNNPVQFFTDSTPKPQARVNAMPQQPNLLTNNEPLGPPPPKISRFQDISTDSYLDYASTENFQATTNMKLPSVKSVLKRKNLLPCEYQSNDSFSQSHGSNINFKNLHYEKPSLNSPEEDDCLNNVDRSNNYSNTFLYKSIMSDTISDVLDIAISAEYSELANKSSFQRVGSNLLTRIEEQKIDELVEANKVMKINNEVDQIFYKNHADSPCLIDVINMTDNEIRKVIKMTKKINAFKSLCQDDQIALLKGNSMELMILRSVMNYDSENDGWPVPLGVAVPESLKNSYIKMDVLKEAKGNIYEVHKQFLKSFDSTWRHDEKLMLILGTIVLFNPRSPSIVHCDVIKLEQYSYYFLLQRYLESTYSGCNAKSQFLKLIQTLRDLPRLHEKHIQLFMDLNAKDIEPLLIEIFDVGRKS